MRRVYESVFRGVGERIGKRVCERVRKRNRRGVNTGGAGRERDRGDGYG